MNKKLILTLFLVFSLLLVGCGVQTTPKVDEQDKQDSSTEAAKEVTLDFLYMSTWGGKDAPIVKDQLEKAGIKVNLIQVPDYAAYKERIKAGTYDIVFSGWNTVTGNPDYAVRSIFVPGGDYNDSGIDDAAVTEAILKAGTQTPDAYVKTYHDFEAAMLEHAYIVPLYNITKSQAFNKALLKADSVRLSKSRATDFAAMAYNDQAEEQRTPLLVSQNTGDLTSLDPIKANDGSINTINTNMYVRLVNLTDDDQVTAKDSLSHSFAIAEGNQAYYFLLRDNVRFASLKDGAVVDTKERVGAEDVIYSMDRAKDKDAVPDHRTYTLHGHMQTISEVTDLKELEETKLQDGSSVLEALSKGLDGSIETLVADKNEADNAKGAYQVVKIETTEAFPQVLNFLAHQSAGIVSEKQVSKINKDGVYGDQGEAFKDDHLYASGPYILTAKDDQKITMKKNPYFMPGTDSEAKIEEVDILIIPDSNAAVQALLSGELHLLYSVPPLHMEKVEKAEDLALVERSSNSTNYLIFNMNAQFKRPVMSETLRHAVSLAIDPKAFIQIVQSGKAMEIATTVTPLIRDLEGYEPVEKVTDLDKAKEALAEYFKEVK